MIESLNARLRKATRNRGAFPSEQAALKTLYLTVRTMTRPDGAIGITRSNGWKAKGCLVTRCGSVGAVG
jgi:transposase-like protein